MIINGIEYEKIVYQAKKQPKVSAYTAALMMIYGGGMLGTIKRNRSVDNTGIEAEFELIQQKKSKLSRSEREAVIARFNKIYKPVNEVIDEQP